MTPSPEIALVVAVIALLGVVLTAAVAIFNARSRADIDAQLVELKSRFDQLNAMELAKVQAQHSAKLKELEFERSQKADAYERSRRIDSAAMKNIMSALDQDRTISFLRDHDFNGIFDRQDCNSIYGFLALSERPESEFLNPQLEELRIALVQLAKKLATSIALKTFPRHGSFSSALPEAHINDERPDWVSANATEINENATNFVGAFDTLVRQARVLHML